MHACSLRVRPTGDCSTTGAIRRGGRRRSGGGPERPLPVRGGIPTRHKKQEEARGTAATGSRERRHSDEERRGEEKMQESASTNQHPHQHQLTEAAQASLGRGVSRSVDSHSRHIILILSLYSSHKYSSTHTITNTDASSNS